MKIKILTLLALVAIKSVAQEKPFELEKKWSVSGFEVPESVSYDAKNKALYVSNIKGGMGEKDGNGYISKLGLDGKIISKKWITGLNAPKGMGLYNGKLYVADITQIVEIDIKNSKIINRYDAPEATFLNDISIDSEGNVFASNTFGENFMIYKLSKGKVSIWLKDKSLNMPNGLLVSGDNLYLGTWGEELNPKTFQTKVPGDLLKISLKTKKIEVVVKKVGNIDGVVKTIHGYLMSDYIAGKLVYVKDNENTSVDVITVESGAADIEFNKTHKVVYVPQMQAGRIDAYAIKK